MKGHSVHPLLAVIIIAVTLGGLYYVFNNVMSGKTTGQVGSPGMVKSKP